MKNCLGCFGILILVFTILAGGMYYLMFLADKKTNPIICWIRDSRRNTAVAEINSYVPTDGVKTGKTRISNGEIVEWAENYKKDASIKPLSVVYEEKGHKITYNFEGHVIVVAVNNKGVRYFYKDGSGVTFAQIGSDVKDSNESILYQVKANDEIIKKTKEKYK